MAQFLDIALPTRRASIRLARALASALEPGDVVFLEGPLGAGKTFLARAVCRALGVPSRVPIQSPTFALVHEHEAAAGGATVRIVHADLYRLASARELDELGLPDLLEGAVGLVEWGLRFADPIAKDGVAVVLRLASGARLARVSGRGPRGHAILDRLSERLPSER